MADALTITCPECAKAMKVPAKLVGQRIRCKGCETIFEVRDPSAPKPAAKSAKPKPAADTNAPIQFQDDPAKPSVSQTSTPAAPGKVARPFDDDPDDDGTANPYGVTRDEFDIPRCPFCAKELDPPDTKICLSCGYDLIARKRHASKKVYELTAGDYFMHWLPAILWIIALLALLGGATFASLSMRGWLADSFLAKDEKNPVTNAVEFYLPPFCFNIWIWIFTLYFTYLGGRFIIRRLVFNWRPEEVIKKS